MINGTTRPTHVMIDFEDFALLVGAVDALRAIAAPMALSDAEAANVMNGIARDALDLLALRNQQFSNHAERAN